MPQDVAKTHSHCCSIPLPTLSLQSSGFPQNSRERCTQRMPWLHIPAGKWEFRIWTALGLPSLGSAE